MELTLYMPGLSWPDAHDGPEVARGLALSALSVLLGRGRRTPVAASCSATLAALFGVAGIAGAGDLARRSGLGAGVWLHADPVHLHADRDRVRLSDAGVLGLDSGEAAALLAALNAHFADDGLVFAAHAPDRWLVRLPDAPRVRFTPLPDVCGEDVHDHMPQGEAARQWRRWLNEIQMLLFDHPVNAARDAAGLPAANSVWFWGGETETAGSTVFDRVACSHPLLQDLAVRAGVPCEDAPWDLAALLDAGLTGHVLVECDRLQGAAQHRDAFGWRDALLALEADWFVPALAALRAGRLRQLALRCHGAPGLDVVIRRPDLWKCWRRPVSLADLY